LKKAMDTSSNAAFSKGKNGCECVFTASGFGR